MRGIRSCLLQQPCLDEFPDILVSLSDQNNLGLAKEFGKYTSLHHGSLGGMF